MRWRLLIGLLVLIVLFAASQLAGRLSASREGLPLAAPRLQPAASIRPDAAWTVENRCRTLYLPAILAGGSGGFSAAFAPAQPAQRASLDCLWLSDADLARIAWDAAVATYARQANRNRQGFDMPPLSSWGH